MIRIIKKLYSIFVDFSYWFRVVKLNLHDSICIHSSCVIQKRVVLKVWKEGSISVGARTEIMHGAIILTYGGKIAIGADCSINPYCILYGHGGLTIGNNVLIAGGTMLVPNNHIYSAVSAPISVQGNISKGIIIEDDVWIGHACSILDGVTIGKGSVIAAGSVVNADVEPYTVVGGVPSRIIKRRTTL